MRNRLLGIGAGFSTITGLSLLVAATAWGQQALPPGYVPTLDSVAPAESRAVTRGGRVLQFDTSTIVVVGGRELTGPAAIDALAPGMSVQLMETRVLPDGALAVERLEIVPK